MATPTSSTPSGAAPQASFSQRVRNFGQGIKGKVAGLVPHRKAAGTPEQSLEEKLQGRFAGALEDYARVYDHQLALQRRDETLEYYFTTVVPYHDRREAAVTQYNSYIGNFFEAGWNETGRAFAPEGAEAVQLFFERFPIVQSRLPLRYSKRWAEDRLGDLKEYLSNRRNPPKSWDQTKAHEELVNGFTDDKNIKRYHKQHRGRQKLWKGIGITAASAALLSMGLYFHNREGKLGELEEEVGQQGQAIIRLTDANSQLEVHKLRAENERDQLRGERNALNSQYDALSSAVTMNNIPALKQAVCRYLATVNDDIVFKQTSQNSALSQLFAAMVGPPGGRNDYDSQRQGFVNRLKPTFPTADPSGYYQFFTNDDCRRVPK